MEQRKTLGQINWECAAFRLDGSPVCVTPAQMGVRVKMCHDYHRKYKEEGDNFLNRVITCDETWIHFYEPESKLQSSVWKHPSSPSPTKALVSKSAGKGMAIIFCDIYGILLNHFVPPKTTVTGNYYAALLRSELMSAIRKKNGHVYLRQVFTCTTITRHATRAMLSRAQ